MSGHGDGVKKEHPPVDQQSGSTETPSRTGEGSDSAMEALKKSRIPDGAPPAKDGKRD